MLSFHNDPLIKEKYINRVIAHRKADKIIQGIGWNNGRGCAVGCTLENYDHSRYPIELGLPEWLARLEDSIFENLSLDIAILWPEKFLQSIPIGINVEKVKYKLSILRLNRLIEIQKSLLEKNPDLNEIFRKVINAIEVIIKYHEAEINNIYCNWSAAESAAWSAGSAAGSAAWKKESAESAESAAWSAIRPSAGSSAESAGSAAWSVAASSSWSARSAAWSEAWSAAWSQESDDLLKLLSECK